jgi:pimeloyl-ACP methyl ester carboxylesterase
MRALLSLAVLAIMHCHPANSADGMNLVPAYEEPLLGPAKAKGIIVWSHGRSINAEDSQSPTPSYLTALRDDGWDVERFERMSHGDTLADSTKRLVDLTVELKQAGYKQVALAGQSFGAFLALMAANASDKVDVVIATAPAAYGSFDDFYESWQLNATRLYPLLQNVKRARVMVFYFHGDDFDPGGRGERSRAILSARKLGFSVVDQPAFMAGHWASSTGLFLRRYGECIRDFANKIQLQGEFACEPRWGTTPSADVRLPKELYTSPSKIVEVKGEVGSGTVEKSAKARFTDTWFGFYPNGRQVVFGIETLNNSELVAIYAIGQSVDGKHAAAWTRRSGVIKDDKFLFEEGGESMLLLSPRPDGGLTLVWTKYDYNESMTAHLKPIDPKSIFTKE